MSKCCRFLLACYSFILLMGILAVSIQATPVKDAKSAYDSGNYTNAVALYQKAAGDGDTKAQYTLGIMYEYGRGVQQDLKEAMKLYLEAARKGNASAQNNLGCLYYSGKGTPRNYSKAYEWFMIAVNNTNKGSRNESIVWCNLGNLYLKGLGVKRDYVKAVDCYIKAADGGNMIPPTVLDISTRMGWA